MRRSALLLLLLLALACTAKWSSLVRYSDRPAPTGLSQVAAVYQAVLADYYRPARDTLFVELTPEDTIAEAEPMALVGFGSPGLPSEWADTLKREVVAALADSGYGRWLAGPELVAAARTIALQTALRDSAARRFPQFGMTRPGFNADSTIAVVRVSYVCGGLCGSGGVLYLARHPGTAWRIWMYHRAWVS